MSGAPTTPPSGNVLNGDPALLLEASRVFNAAGPQYARIAEVVSESALQLVKYKKDAADQDTRTAIICDAAALRLSGRVRGGFEDALKLLDTVEVPNDKRTDYARVFILRALANGQRYRSQHGANTLGAADALVAVRENLAAAFAADPDLYAQNRHFWDMTAPRRSNLDKYARDQEDDLAAAYKDDVELRTMLALTAAPAVAGKTLRLVVPDVNADLDPIAAAAELLAKGLKATVVKTKLTESSSANAIDLALRAKADELAMCYVSSASFLGTPPRPFGRADLRAVARHCVSEPSAPPLFLGVVAPLATPNAAIDALDAAIREVIETPEHKAALEALRLMPAYLGPNEFEHTWHG